MVFLTDDKRQSWSVDKASRNGSLPPEVNSAQHRALRRRFSQTAFKRLLPHTSILIAVLIYTIGGGYIFYAIENPSRSSFNGHSTLISPTQGNSAATASSTDPYTRVMKRAAQHDHNVGHEQAMNRNRRADRIKKQMDSNNDHPDEEEEESSECSSDSLSSVVTQARKMCMKAIAADRNSVNEFPAHYCSHLLNRLYSCLSKFDSTTSPQPPSPKESVDELTVSSYIFMAFTIISTIGYGHVAPVTMWGRIFCIIYGLFGIPLALLAIADQGRFLSAAIMHVYKQIKMVIRERYRYISRRRDANAFLHDEETDSEEESMPATLLLVVFGVYMLIGGIILTPYEHWSYVDAVYFSFISSSSIGFGDLLPREGPYLPITLLYVALGLALSTAAIDVFAGYLRRLHHWGKKIRNCANKLIWFGGKRVTLTQLVRNIGVQLGVPEEKINHLVEHFDEVVQKTIQQAEGTMTQSTAPLMEQKPVEPKLLAGEIDFIDDRDLVPV